MNHAKFCPATQGWSTPEWVNPFLLLRRRSLAKQEQDHGHESRAMPLRDWPFFEVCGGAERDGNPPIKRKRPGDPGRRRPAIRLRRRAAALVSTTRALAWLLPIGIWRGFFASGISRTRSTCRSPFSRLAFLTRT